MQILGMHVPFTAPAVTAQAPASTSAGAATSNGPVDGYTPRYQSADEINHMMALDNLKSCRESNEIRGQLRSDLSASNMPDSQKIGFAMLAGSMRDCDAEYQSTLSTLH